jgi:hypothetical protein
MIHKLSLNTLTLMANGIVADSAVIADFSGEFSPVTPAAGWQYLRNTGSIGTSANYVPLLWDATHNLYDVNGTTLPAANGDFTLISAAGITHPGLGTVQGQGFNGYAIAAYTIQAGEAGNIDVVNGNIRGTDPAGASGASNGWDLRFFVNDVQNGPTLTISWSATDAPFSQSIGMLTAGDTVYVALGPNSNFLFDSAGLQFQLTSTPAAVPEPGTVAMTLVGLTITALRFRRRRDPRA